MICLIITQPLIHHINATHADIQLIKIISSMLLLNDYLLINRFKRFSLDRW